MTSSCPLSQSFNQWEDLGSEGWGRGICACVSVCAHMCAHVCVCGVCVHALMRTLRDMGAFNPHLHSEGPTNWRYKTTGKHILAQDAMNYVGTDAKYLPTGHRRGSAKHQSEESLRGPGFWISDKLSHPEVSDPCGMDAEGEGTEIRLQGTEKAQPAGRWSHQRIHEHILSLTLGQYWSVNVIRGREMYKMSFPLAH